MQARPVNRVFGSKARVAEELLRLVPPGLTTWAEVFAGSAAVTLAKAPHRSEHLNDLDGEIVNLFRVLRTPDLREQLRDAVSLTPWSQEEFNATRAAAACDDPVERARRYLVISWQGMGGKRGSRTGWTYDIGASCVRPRVWAKLPARIAVAAARLQAVHIHQRDASDFVGLLGKHHDACLFIDPPYPRGSISSDGQIYSIDMTLAEHEALAKQVREVSARVILTMSVGTIYDDALAGWWRQDLHVRGLKNAVKTERVFCNFVPRTSLFDGHPMTEAEHRADSLASYGLACAAVRARGAAE